MNQERYFFANPAKEREHLPKTPDPESLQRCAFMLSSLGWDSQQGRHESAMRFITELYQMSPDTFLKAIANGLAVIQDALDRIEPEPPAGTPDTPEVPESHYTAHTHGNTPL